MDLSQIDHIRKLTDSIENWENINEGTKLSTIRQLKSIARIEKCSIPKNSELSCPEYNHRLSQPCGLSACEFYIKDPTNYNCIYHSLDNAKKKRLTTKEVSVVLECTETEVNTTINSAIQKIRVVRLEDEINATKPNKFEYLPGHCVNCGVDIADELDLGESQNLIIEYGKYGYCSETCKKEKPVWKFKLEHRFCTDWEYVTFKSHQYLNTIKTSHKEIESMLGIDPNNLKEKDKERVTRYRRAYDLG
jgi:hypothetical protein